MNCFHNFYYAPSNVVYRVSLPGPGVELDGEGVLENSPNIPWKIKANSPVWAELRGLMSFLFCYIFEKYLYLMYIRTYLT